MIKKYINGRSCAILGFGVSNQPLAKYLCEQGIRISVYDKSPPSELGQAAAALADKGVCFHVSDKDFSNIDGDIVFRSPGIRPDREGLVSAGMRGATLTSETELFLRLTPAHTYGITGSDGKTTSTTLTGKFLEAQCQRSGIGSTYVGGNIGTPLLTLCPDMTANDSAVLELSSFQLMNIGFSVEAAAITNISPNHLDWHTDMNEYIAAKCNMIGENTRRLVTNAECMQTLKIAKELARNDLDIFLFSSVKHSYSEFSQLAKQPFFAVYEKDGYITVDDGSTPVAVLSCSDIKLLGKHNVENCMTAVALTYGSVDTDIYSEVAKSFFGVEHRLELVRVKDGIAFYNSSIDSSPSRTAAALSALSGKSLVLICGGYDKKIPYAPLAKSICTHGGVHTLVLTGATGGKIGEEMQKYISEHGVGGNIRIIYQADFVDAVHTAYKNAKFGDIVLLSPASASFDCFKNFAERGNTFKKTVKEI